MSSVTNFNILSYTEGLNDFMLTFKWNSPENTSNLTGYDLYQAENSQDVGVKIVETTSTSHVLQYVDVIEPTENFYYVLPMYSDGAGVKSNIIGVTFDRNLMQSGLFMYYGVSNASMRTLAGRVKTWL